MRRASQSIMFDLIYVLLPILIFVGITNILVKAYRRARRKVLDTWPQVPATVLAYQQTESSADNIPLVKFRVRVEPPNSAPYEVTFSQFINLIDVPSIQSGGKILVRVCPTDPMMVDDITAPFPPPAPPAQP